MAFRDQDLEEGRFLERHAGLTVVAVVICAALTALSTCIFFWHLIMLRFRDSVYWKGYISS